MKNIAKLVRDRRSVRTFDGAPLSDTHLSQIRDFIADIANPWDIPVEFRLLGADAYGLTSPVISGTRLYVGAKVRRVPYAEEAFGYSMETLVLFAQSLGIGTVWLGGTMKRDGFAKAMEVGEDEMMPCVSPLGYPAKQMGLKERMMRTAVKADSRQEFGTLFYDGSSDVPLTPDRAGWAREPLELVRLAPSAVNKQPWRVILCGASAHFYEKKSRGFVSDATGDLQKVDLGIALCHFDLAVRDAGMTAAYSIANPGIPVEADMEYIGTWTVQESLVRPAASRNHA